MNRLIFDEEVFMQMALEDHPDAVAYGDIGVFFPERYRKFVKLPDTPVLYVEGNDKPFIASNMGEIFDDILYSHYNREIAKIELINGALSIQLDDHPVGHRYTIRAVSPLGIARMRMSRQVVIPDESVFFLPIG
jgi:hypothetical protein